MICVYSPDCIDFSTNGNGVLSPLTAQVTETLTGEYELQLTHPLDDAGKWQRLVEDAVLCVPVATVKTVCVDFLLVQKMITERKLGGSTKIPPVRKPARAHFA